jgi:hypothetical protein
MFMTARRRPTSAFVFLRNYPRNFGRTLVRLCGWSRLLTAPKTSARILGCRGRRARGSSSCRTAPAFAVGGFERALRPRRYRTGACCSSLQPPAMWRGRTGGCAGVTSGFPATDQTHGPHSRRRTCGLPRASGSRSHVSVAAAEPAPRLRASRNSAASAPRRRSSGRGTPMTGKRWRLRGSVAMSGALRPVSPARPELVAVRRSRPIPAAQDR